MFEAQLYTALLEGIYLGGSWPGVGWEWAPLCPPAGLGWDFLFSLILALPSKLGTTYVPGAHMDHTPMSTCTPHPSSLGVF